MASIGPPQPSTPLADPAMRPMRQVQLEGGGTLATPLSQEALEAYYAARDARIAESEKQLRAIYGPAAREESLAREPRPDPLPALDTARRVRASLTAKLAEAEAARQRAQQHLESAESDLSAARAAHQKADAEHVEAARQLCR